MFQRRLADVKPQLTSAGCVSRRCPWRPFSRNVSGLLFVPLALMLFAMGWAPSALFAQEPPQPAFSADDLEFFEKEVRPLLAKRCFECHGPDEDDPAGGLHMISREALIEGGDTGSAIDLESLEDSLLLEVISYGGLFEMPPDSKMPDAEIAVLTRWVEVGVPWPSGEAAKKIGPKQFDLQQRRSEHWCWQPVIRPALPETDDANWPRRDLDRFILDRLRREGLSPAPEADRRTLIRRLTFDLTGLPPTPEEVEAYLTDTSDDAYERLVDRLLASPRFGEHWARRWMDLVRYAETCGHEYDYPIPHAYQFRDYLIRAFNADVPYDQFVREHIAGDLLAKPRRNPTDVFNESIIGTGFWFLGEATHGPVDVRGDEAGRIDNQIDVFGKTFLGLTIACARCHDHMFDAIATRDYYGLSGFLQSSRRQLALLDPGRKIETAHRALISRQSELDRQLASVQAATAQADWEAAALTLAAALEFAAGTGARVEPATIRIQGEDLASPQPSGGRTVVQDLSAAGEVRWDGGKHLWWLDGQPGDQLDLPLDLPIAGEYGLFAEFTMAPDYGVVELQLDGQPLGEPMDLYAPTVTKTGPRTLRAGHFEKGEHRLTIKLNGKNPEAVPKYMFGLDFIEWKAQPSVAAAKRREQLELLARERDLRLESLVAWTEALRDGRLAEPSHPLHAVSSLLQTKSKIDRHAIQQLVSQLTEEQNESERILADSPTFEDFNDSALPGWYQSGWAFDSGSHSGWSADDSHPAGQFVARPGTISSGSVGTPLYGVLRSPTFELTRKFVHYRAAGRDVELRVIIDGFTLDTYNPLLFNGATIRLDSPDRYSWIAQGQDIGNYLGHRAHLEIIDHSGGSIFLDDIRFSDHARLIDPPSNFALEILDRWSAGLDGGSETVSGPASARSDADEDSERCVNLARALVDAMRRTMDVEQPDGDAASLLDWIIRWNLIDVEPFAAKVDGLRQQFEDRRTWLAEHRIPTPTFAVAIADGTGENEFVFVRGNHRTTGTVADRRMIDAISTDISFDLSSDHGSGRLRLAEAVVSPKNPLTARVMVNRLWHHLFGRGLVPSTDNFGVLGEAPTHPELLDYLADEFVTDGWSIKRALQRMVTSATYRMSSQRDEHAERTDPANQWLHRMEIKRASGEVIRDAILQISGRMDPTMFGPGVPLYLTSFMQGRGRPGESGPLDGNGRRSVYLEVRRNFLNPMMLAFDTPSPFNTVGRRTVSNVPSQALILLNHPLVVEQAGLWAERLLAGEPDEQQRFDRMFREAYARPISERERAMCEEFLQQHREELTRAGTPAEKLESLCWRDLCHAVMNAKEFYYVN